MLPQDSLALTVRQNLAGFALSIIILAVALVAFALWLGRSRFKERILLWFGLLALIYATREMAENDLLRIAFGMSRSARDFYISWMDFLILVPGALFFEELLGRGWRSCLRWAVWMFALYAAAGIVLGLWAGRPYVIRDPAVVILLPLILVVALLNWANGYRPPSFPDLRIVLVGLAIFAVFVVGQHALPDSHPEPVGFFALICSLGLVAVRRTLRQERKLLDVEQELAAARRIQTSILPSEAPHVSALDIVARYSLMTSVAGDFYDFLTLSANCAGILIADVAGHGVPAALIASMVKVAFAAQQPHGSHPSRVLSGLNKIFCGQLRGQYVTAGYLVIDRLHETARYAGAGHPPLLVWRSSTGEVERVENNGLFLGFKANEVYPEVSINLFAGDRLLLYTDGLLEAENAAGENFSERLDARIATYRDLSAQAFADALMADLRAWTPASAVHLQEDDITLIRHRCTAAAESLGGAYPARCGPRVTGWAAYEVAG